MGLEDASLHHDPVFSGEVGVMMDVGYVCAVAGFYLLGCLFIQLCQRLLGH